MESGWDFHQAQWLTYPSHVYDSVAWCSSNKTYIGCLWQKAGALRWNETSASEMLKKAFNRNCCQLGIRARIKGKAPKYVTALTKTCTFSATQMTRILNDLNQLAQPTDSIEPYIHQCYYDDGVVGSTMVVFLRLPPLPEYRLLAARWPNCEDLFVVYRKFISYL